MRTPEQWNALINGDYHIRQKRNAVAQEVRQYLSTLLPGTTISTNELGEVLYPRVIAEASNIGDTTRKEIFRLMGLLAKDGLDDCCMKGEVVGTWMGRPRRPWLWFCPEEQKLCPHCGQVVEDAV